MKCAGCGADLDAASVDSAHTAGDCHPLCPLCLRAAGRRLRPSRRSLERSLFAAGRSISRCQVCGAREELEFHFLVPLVRGGTTDSGNLLVLCAACHRRVHQGARLVLHARRPDNSQSPGREAPDAPDPAIG